MNPRWALFSMLQNKQVEIIFAIEKNIAECGDWFIGGFVDATFSGSFKTVSYI